LLLHGLGQNSRVEFVLALRGLSLLGNQGDADAVSF
jgi:hypothetical protein